MRVLITGSRDWDDEKVLRETLGQLPYMVHTIVSGACPTGADMMCEAWAVEYGHIVERHPADWKTHGKPAGFIRNDEMVKLGADVCIAFIKNKSKGATMTANIAQQRGIKTIRIVA